MTNYETRLDVLIYKFTSPVFSQEIAFIFKFKQSKDDIYFAIFSVALVEFFVQKRILSSLPTLC